MPLRHITCRHTSPCSAKSALRLASHCSRAGACAALGWALAISCGTNLLAQPSDATDAAALIDNAYPNHIAKIEAGKVHWRDGTSMPFDDGGGPKAFKHWLDAPDVEDMLDQPYPTGAAITPPGPDQDPGRARNAEFFAKIYGDCRKGEVAPHLVDVVWLPKKWGRKLKVSSVNGVAQQLDAVSRALDALPPRFDRYLLPPAGTYNCRVIAGTNRVSAHGYGIAIDIATAAADYWRWTKPGADEAPIWRNRIPQEIVDIFEKHGFIWGGRWHHFDTMHFEYRPELNPPSRAAAPAARQP